MRDQIQQIPIDQIDDHPDNPRLFLREEVIDGIAAQLEESHQFDPAHALLVRPVNGRYQIVRGHHRKEAALQANLSTVPCWVREMSDDDAYWELGLSNTQDGMEGVEWGMFLLGIESGKGGAGQRGGVREFARETDQKHGTLSIYRQAARVYKKLSIYIDSFLTPDELSNFIRTKTYHLAAIHGAPGELWLQLVDWLMDTDAPVVMVKDKVRKLKDLDAAIPKKWQQTFLPIGQMNNDDGLAQKAKRLVALADGVEAMIDGHEMVDRESFVASFHKWLQDGVGGYSWQADAILDYQQELREALNKLSARPTKNLHLFVSRAERMQEIEAESIDLIITSPPYNLGDESWPMGGQGRKPREHGIGYGDSQEEQEYYNWQVDVFKELYRVAKEGASLFYNHKPRNKDGRLIHPLDWIRDKDNPWVLRQEIVWDRGSTHNHSPTLFWPEDERIYWMTKGKPALPESSIGASTVWRFHGPVADTWHPAPFGEELPRKIMEAVGRPGITVLDPFAGSCTTVKVALDFGYTAIGIDISSEYLNKAIEENKWMIEHEI